MTTYSEKELATMHPRDFRSLTRRGEWTEINPDVCQAYTQANLVILPQEHAFEFMLFCHRNPQPCPLIEVTEPGDPEPRISAPGADLRTDLPKYRIYQDGKTIDEPLDIRKYWKDNFVSFILGCSRGLSWALQTANIPFKWYGIYQSNIPCVPAGRFSGHMAVIVRGFRNAHDAVRTVQITSRYPLMHGPPVHIGDPALIGITLGEPDRLNTQRPSVELPKPAEIIMSWGCGVTPQAVAIENKIPLMITHCPRYLFVTDHLVEELANL